MERARARVGEAADGQARPGSATRIGGCPIVSISGTNGKTTTTRLIAHILREAGQAGRRDDVRRDRRRERDRRAGRLDRASAARRRSCSRDDLDVAVLETARGGILLRGVGYESNEASVVTNVSSDHIDLQGIHTLPELAEVKSIDRPDHEAERAGSC